MYDLNDLNNSEENVSFIISIFFLLNLEVQLRIIKVFHVQSL